MQWFPDRQSSLILLAKSMAADRTCKSSFLSGCRAIFVKRVALVKMMLFKIHLYISGVLKLRVMRIESSAIDTARGAQYVCNEANQTIIVRHANQRLQRILGNNGVIEAECTS